MIKDSKYKSQQEVLFKPETLQVLQSHILTQPLRPKTDNAWQNFNKFNSIQLN